MREGQEVIYKGSTYTVGDLQLATTVMIVRPDGRYRLVPRAEVFYATPENPNGSLYDPAVFSLR